MQKLDNDTRLRAALFLVNVLSGPLCLLPLGKVPFTLWRCPRTMGQIPWAAFCCFPPAGNRSQFPLFLEMTVKNCGWWMKCFFFRRSLLACLSNLGRGGHTMVGKVHLCALGFSTGSLWGFFNLTNFIFDDCGIALKHLSGARRRQRPRVSQESRVCFSQRHVGFQTFQAVNIFLNHTNKKKKSHENKLQFLLKRPHAHEFLFMNTFVQESVKCSHHSTLTAGTHQRQTGVQARINLLTWICGVQACSN